DRTDRADKTPERTKQAEKDEEADQVARHVARFIEAVGNGIENGAKRRRRDSRRSAAAADQSPHRSKQLRIAADLVGAACSAERIEPPYFRAQRQHMAEDEDD